MLMKECLLYSFTLKTNKADHRRSCAPHALLEISNITSGETVSGETFRKLKKKRLKV